MEKPIASRNIQGVTLIELVIVIVILSIISAAGAVLLLNGFNAYIKGKAIFEQSWQANLAVEKLARDISVIRSESNSDLSAADTSSITFVDMSGNTLAYSYNSGTQTLSLTYTLPSSSATTVTLATGIQAFSFKYYNASGTQLTSVPLNTTDLASVRYIAISVQGTGNTLYAISTAVYPRNFM